jgi:hypothetical protein
LLRIWECRGCVILSVYYRNASFALSFLNKVCNSIYFRNKDELQLLGVVKKIKLKIPKGRMKIQNRKNGGKE